jgi:hypothetical protein
MKVGDVIRIPSGAVGAFKLASDIGIVVGTLSRKDDLPDDFEIMVDGLIHAMGSQLAYNTEVLYESR